MAAGDSAKVDQIAFHIYTSFPMSCVLRAPRSRVRYRERLISGSFNLKNPLATPGSTLIVEIDTYRALSTAPPPAVLAVQILFVVPPPGAGTALVHKPSGTHIEPEPRYVLLEEWVLAFAPSPPSASSTSSSASDTSRSSSTDEEGDVLPPTIYKNSIADTACVARRAEACGEEGAWGWADGREARVTGYSKVAAGRRCAGGSGWNEGWSEWRDAAWFRGIARGRGGRGAAAHEYPCFLGGSASSRHTDAFRNLRNHANLLARIARGAPLVALRRARCAPSAPR
ncbi:hypothetical protein B0H19DRAFT_536484 [Mycena capillaripes]|nr:hypothetical protein B0H19DRAFT_536484 [Mycena capillaripes]